MSIRLVPALLLCVCAIPLTIGGSCQPPVDPPQSSGSDDDLTQTERTAIKALIQAAGAFGQAAGTSQSAAGQQSASGDPKPGDLTLGTCPEVTTSTTLGEPGLNVTVDFKTGCTLAIAPDYTCSGGASGQIDFTDKMLDLDFDGISCSGNTALTGAISVGFDVSDSQIMLDGEWDLTYAVEGNSILTFGNGVTRYDLVALSTTITNYAGLLATNGNDWDLTMDQVLVSYAANQSYTPYGGTMTVSGPNIRKLTIRFDTNSPSTGDVEVSVGNGDVVLTINIYSL